MIRNAVRKVRRLISRERVARKMAALSEAEAASGLGDSAWLLYGLARSMKPKVIVEIGSARGRSTSFLAVAAQENGAGKVYAIDPHEQTRWNDIDSVDTFGVLTQNLKRLGVAEWVRILRTYSPAAAKGWTTPIDLLFIDGDHSYDGVRQDWELFSPHVSEFGVVAFHDTLWDIRPVEEYARPDMGVPRFVDELRQAGYPVLTFSNNFGVSLVQPTRGGVPLSPVQ